VPTPGSGQIKVNFQPADAGPTAPGYLIDTGLAYGDRGNGQTYGWNANNTANTRRRNATADVRSDTLIHMQVNGTFTWEYAIANGSYDVLIAAGDPSFTDSVHSFSVEGFAVSDCDGMDNFDSYGARVTVTDGKLTVVPTGVNTKLDFLEITPADTTAPIVQSMTFQYQTSQAIAVQFNEAMDAATIQAADLIVQAAAGGATFSAASVSYSPQTDIATFFFAALPDGNYTAKMPAGSVADAKGNAAAQDFSATFFVLTGDANRDGAVDNADFTALAANFNRTDGVIFAEGDFNYDGAVNALDFNAIASRFGQSV
jgi:hypothetical protein